MKNKKAKTFLSLIIFVFLICLIIVVSFVFAEHIITTSTGETSYIVSEDLGFIYNLTINNTDIGQDANITQINITIPNSFSFILSSQGTSASNVNFTNTTNVLTWTNLTYYAINGSTNLTRFWFNATASTSGTYNITVTTLNSSGAFTSNISVTVNDTTVPSAINFVDFTPVNGSIVVSNLVVNLTATDNGVIDTITVELFNSTRNQINSSNSSSSPLNYTFSGLPAGTYYINATVNDSSGNSNSTETRTIIVAGISFVLNGTILNISSSALNNTVINVTISEMGANGPSAIGYRATTSNASGWFNLSIPGNGAWMYQAVIRHFNGSVIDYIGQSLPHFPYSEFSGIRDVNFFLKSAGTINITAINSSGDNIAFNYMIKDTKLGYSIESNWATTVSEVIVYVPKDRNYSIMVFPQNSLPVSYNWNNFTSDTSYTFGQSLSSYNATTNTLQKQFNTSMSLIRVTGYLQNISGDDFLDWNEFTIVPYLLEPGNMIFMSQGALPYNMSSWNAPVQGDYYNLTNGYYNITLPGPAESGQSILLFATARNGTNYYGSYKNISVSYGESGSQYNITMYPLMSTDWASKDSNISLRSASDWSLLNISSAKQRFNLVNSSNLTLTSMNAHIEVTVDYSSYGAMEFTFMEDISSANGTFYIPLINSTGIKEINVYSQAYAPKRVSTKTADEILVNNNVTMATFNPQTLDGITGANISIALYISNSTCDLPGNEATCIVGSSGDMSSFNPLSSIVGGGALSFRMGIGGVLVHYVNVDMLASGPPDALFEDNNGVTEQTSGNFGKIMKFGSQGPSIYDYVLISIPYTEGTSTTAGLYESADVNISLPLFYDENWNIIWNSSLNGTNASSLSANYSHYNSKQSEWQTLMGDNNCTKTASQFNATNPCYIDTTNNRIWIRIPHFSGTGPKITGQVTSVSSSSDSSSSSGGSSSSSGGATYTITNNQFSLGYTRTYLAKDKIKFSVNKINHTITIDEITENTLKISIASTPNEATLQIGDLRKFDTDDDSYYDTSVKLNSITAGATKASVTVKSMNEKITEEIKKEEEKKEEKAVEKKEADEQIDKKSSTWLWILVILIIIGVVLGIVYFSKNKKIKKIK